jgi:hypothetical protein
LRVAVDVDGRQHYADGEKASPSDINTLGGALSRAGDCQRRTQGTLKGPQEGR